MGVLSQRVGDGTYLSFDSAESILDEPLDFLILLDDLSHHELFETRLIVEPELTARAAERATAEDISDLRNAIFAMERSKTTRDPSGRRSCVPRSYFPCQRKSHLPPLLFKGIHRSLLTSMSHLQTAFLSISL